MKRLKKHGGKTAAVLIVTLLFIIAYFSSREPAQESKNEIKKDEQNSLVLLQNKTDPGNEKTQIRSGTDGENKPEPVQKKENEEETVNLPQEPIAEEPAEDDKKTICTLSVRCDTINQNIELLDKSKKSLIPSDGVIYSQTNVEFEDGESVFDILLREMKSCNIHFEYVNMPMYDSAYIEGISNIYEFDCGELSGWMYSVNGVFPSCGCSQYKVKDRDVIEVVYTCDMGKDAGKN